VRSKTAHAAVQSVATGLAPPPRPLSDLALVLDPKPVAYFGRGTASSPVVAAVRESLKGAGISVTIFGGVTPNPTTICVDEGSDLAAAVGADGIVAVGGGSSMDAAKGIALGALNPKRGIDLDYRSVFEHPALPIVAVPTTAGTGAEVNAFGVITASPAWRSHSASVARTYRRPRTRSALSRPSLRLLCVWARSAHSRSSG